MIRSLLYANASSTVNTILPPSLRTNLVAWWKLNEATGTRINSVSPSTLDLLMNGLVSSDAGLIDSCLKGVDGFTNTLEIVHSLNAPPPDLSLAQDFSTQVWLKFPVASGDFPLVMNTSWGSYGLYWYYNANSNIVYAFFNNGANGLGIDAFISPLSVDTWHHFVLTYHHASKTVKAYLNNSLVGTRIMTLPLTNANTRDFCVGSVKNGFGVPLACYDEAAWWANKELTASDISTLYNGGSGATY